jgi:hypothetical protein
VKLREILFPIKELPHWYTLTSPENGAVASPEKNGAFFSAVMSQENGRF